MLFLSIFQAYIIASRVYFRQVSCLYFKPISSLLESILVKSLVHFLSLHPWSTRSLFYSSQTKLDAARDRLTFGPIINSRWPNKSIMLLLFQFIRPMNFPLLCTFLSCIYFCIELHFCPHILLQLMYLWIWCSIIWLIFRVATMLVVY